MQKGGWPSSFSVSGSGLWKPEWQKETPMDIGVERNMYTEKAKTFYIVYPPGSRAGVQRGPTVETVALHKDSLRYTMR